MGHAVRADQHDYLWLAWVAVVMLRTCSVVDECRPMCDTVQTAFDPKNRLFLSSGISIEFPRRSRTLSFMPPMLRRMIDSQLKDDAYAFVFSQQGLTAGVSIEGTRISRVKR
jgi:hypothetical protein